MILNHKRDAITMKAIITHIDGIQEEFDCTDIKSVTFVVKEDEAEEVAGIELEVAPAKVEAEVGGTVIEGENPEEVHEEAVTLNKIEESVTITEDVLEDKGMPRMVHNDEDFEPVAETDIVAEAPAEAKEDAQAVEEVGMIAEEGESVLEHIVASVTSEEVAEAPAETVPAVTEQVTEEKKVEEEKKEVPSTEFIQV